MVACKLLTFLEDSDLPSFFSSVEDENPGEIIMAYSLQEGRGIYKFATFNWYRHLKECTKHEDSDLEERVLRFLSSTSLIRWLKSAIILSHSTGRGDSVSLAVDVIDSLQSWVQGRSWSVPHSAAKVQTWIEDFRDLMLDWGVVLDTQPDWIHYLHHQLLSGTSFRTILEDDGDQSVVQLHPGRIITKSSETATWPTRSFVVDLERDLAFTYDEQFISCYHIKTGLLTAETLVPIPSKVGGPLAVRKGALCPKGKYLAVLFEALGPSTDPVGGQIRAGHRISMDDAACTLAWSIEKGTEVDISTLLPYLTIGVENLQFVVCVLELNHTGPARTHLFGLPSWTTTPILNIGTQTMRWEVDGVDALAFSDSGQLATPFGIVDMNSGEKTKPWSFALGDFFRGGKVTNELKIFATISPRPIESTNTIQLYDIRGKISQEFELPGIVHILAISDRGRFLLLLRVRIGERSKTSRPNTLLSQQGSIGIWDCCKAGWTPLLMLDRPATGKRAPWNFCNYTFPPRFSPEAKETHEVNKVLLYAPPKWRLAKNVSPASTLDPEQGHLLLFEAKRSTSPAVGFGEYLMLKLQLPSNVFRFVLFPSPH